MTDVHCHLNFKSFQEDYDAVITEAAEEGVGTIINVGTQISSSKRAVELANQYENLFAIAGVHPHHADKPEENWVKQLEELAKDPKVVAIGEIGMDYYRYKSNGITEPKLQKDLFIKQIELAHKLKLPLQIHNRHAGKDILEILGQHKSLLLKDKPGMFHCFAGTIEILKSALQMGFYIGFDGNITYKGIAPGETVELKELVKYTPIDRIVTETDSPYLTPEPHRGGRNKPSYVILVAKAIAEIKGLDFSVVKDQTTQNARKLFGI